jgi:signal peptidase II
MSLLIRRFFPLYLGIIILVADVITKYLTNTYLPLMRNHWLWYPYGGIGVFKDFFGIEFSLSHQINHGAAWGVLAEYQTPLLYLRIALIAGLLVFALFYNKHPSRNIPLALIIAGAIGNVIDYFVYGHVVDMLHFVLWGYDFPVFNLADTSIFIGVTYLLVLSSLEKHSPPKKARR